MRGAESRGEMPFRDQMPKPAGAEAPRQTAHQAPVVGSIAVGATRLPSYGEPDSPNTTLKKTLNILPAQPKPSPEVREELNGPTAADISQLLSFGEVPNTVSSRSAVFIASQKNTCTLSQPLL